MANNSNGSSSSSSAAVAASSFDNLFIQNLMSRLQLRPPYLDTNSFLSHSLDEFLLQDRLSEGDEEDEEGAGGGISSLCGAEDRRRRQLAREEAKLEKEIIRIIQASGANEALKANSGQSVAIGDHNICVGSHEEPGSEYRVWEWHGHIMFFDDEDGYSAEYIYGNYFERLPERKKGAKAEAQVKEDDDDDEDVKTKVKGLLDLIGDSKGLDGGAGGRVLHRNLLNASSSARVLESKRGEGSSAPSSSISTAHAQKREKQSYFGVTEVPATVKGC